MPAAARHPYGETASVTIHDGKVVAGTISDCKLRKQVEQFIAPSHDALMDLWEGRIDHGELGDRIKSIAGL